MVVLRGEGTLGVRREVQTLCRTLTEFFSGPLEIETKPDLFFLSLGKCFFSKKGEEYLL